jgi:hypothetical protein
MIVNSSYHCAVLAVWTQNGPTFERVAADVVSQGSSAIQLICEGASVSSCSDSIVDMHNLVTNRPGAFVQRTRELSHKVKDPWRPRIDITKL